MTVRIADNSVRPNERGFSLLELLIVCVIMTIVLGMIGICVTGLQSSYNDRRQRSEQLADGAAAIDLMTRVIRAAGANTTAQALTPTGATELRIRADWNPVDGALTGAYEDTSFFAANGSLFMRNESTNQVAEVIGNVTSITFTYYDSSGGVTSVPANISRVKIQLEVGNVNTRTFTADIVVRKGLQIK